MNLKRFLAGPSRADRVRAHEELVAAALGGHRQPGSGNRPGARGDVRHPGLYIEAKLTDAESIRVEGGWLACAAERARAQQKRPAIAIAVGGLDEDLRDWVVIRLEHLAELMRSREGAR